MCIRDRVKAELCGPDSVIGGTGSSHNRINRGEAFIVHFKVAGCVRLAIQINQQNFEALFRKNSGQIDGGGCFSYSAFFVRCV